MYQYTQDELLELRYGVRDFAQAFHGYYSTHDIRDVARVAYAINLITSQEIINHEITPNPMGGDEEELFRIANFITQVTDNLTGEGELTMAKKLNDIMWAAAKK